MTEEFFIRIGLTFLFLALAVSIVIFIWSQRGKG